MNMHDIKLFAKSEKELVTLIQAIRIYCQGIYIYQPLGSRRIWHKIIFKRSLTGLYSEFSFS